MLIRSVSQDLSMVIWSILFRPCKLYVVVALRDTKATIYILNKNLCASQKVIWNYNSSRSRYYNHHLSTHKSVVRCQVERKKCVTRLLRPMDPTHLVNNITPDPTNVINHINPLSIVKPISLSDAYRTDVVGFERKISPCQFRCAW
jgi:hypothetical protein